MANVGDDIYTEEGLKATFKVSPLEEILRCRYKYLSADKRHYILVIYKIGLHDRVCRAKWSKYSCVTVDIILEDQVMLENDFDNMLESEEWTREGYEMVVCQ